MNTPRPTSRTPEVIRTAAEALAPRVARWVGEPVSDDLIDQLSKALAWEPYDSYRMAKYLDDRFSWNADSELVDVLDGVDLRAAADATVKAWVKANNISLRFTVGQQVNTPKGVGTIRDMAPETATYTVHVPSQERHAGYLGTIFPAEDCSPITETEPA